jgi:hypothetical protein
LLAAGLAGVGKAAAAAAELPEGDVEWIMGLDFRDGQPLMLGTGNAVG